MKFPYTGEPDPDLWDLLLTMANLDQIPKATTIITAQSHQNGCIIGILNFF